MLCAAAIAFLTAVATTRALRRRGHFGAGREPDMMALLDLVALATVCDVMPLTGLNRAFVTQGLKVMARRERVGINALLDVAAVKDRPSAMTLGFALGPRVMTTIKAVESGGFLTPGLPFGETARLVLPANADPNDAKADLRAQLADLKHVAPAGGLRRASQTDDAKLGVA